MKRHERINRGIFSTITTEVDTLEAPCRLMPEHWNAPTNPGHMSRAEWARLDSAAAECHQCPVLAACLRYVAGWSHPDGVIAGQVWRDGVRLA